MIPAEIPAHLQWGQRQGLRRQHGPRGARQCVWCHTPIKDGRRSTCGTPCKDAYRSTWSWPVLRLAVIRRDRVCQMCATDFPGWNQSRTILHYGYYNEPRCTLVEWWEVDHIRPVIEGGTDHPNNLRLLCHKCHLTRRRPLPPEEGPHRP